MKKIYKHLRKDGSTSICNKTGVHTTKKLSQVTCQNCTDMNNAQSN